MTSEAAARLAILRGASVPPALVEDEQLATAVDVSIAHGPEGADYRAFDCCVCHRRCCVPDLRVHGSADVREEVTSAGAMMVLHYKDAGRSCLLLALVFTLLPNLTFGVPGAEFSSVLVSLLLTQGFQLALGADVDLILGDATEVKPGTSCTLHPQGLLVLQVGGQPMYSPLLDREDPMGPRGWKQQRTAAPCSSSAAIIWPSPRPEIWRRPPLTEHWSWVWSPSKPLSPGGDGDSARIPLPMHRVTGRKTVGHGVGAAGPPSC